MLKDPQIGNRGPGLTPNLGDHIAHALDEYTLVTVIYDMKTMTVFLWAGSEEAVNEIA